MKAKSIDVKSSTWNKVGKISFVLFCVCLDIWNDDTYKKIIFSIYKSQKFKNSSDIRS